MEILEIPLSAEHFRIHVFILSYLNHLVQPIDLSRGVCGRKARIVTIISTDLGLAGVVFSRRCISVPVSLSLVVGRFWVCSLRAGWGRRRRRCARMLMHCGDCAKVDGLARCNKFNNWQVGLRYAADAEETADITRYDSGPCLAQNVDIQCFSE